MFTSGATAMGQDPTWNSRRVGKTRQMGKRLGWSRRRGGKGSTGKDSSDGEASGLELAERKVSLGGEGLSEEASGLWNSAKNKRKGRRFEMTVAKEGKTSDVKEVGGKNL